MSYSAWKKKILRKITWLMYVTNIEESKMKIYEKKSKIVENSLD